MEASFGIAAERCSHSRHVGMMMGIAMRCDAAPHPFMKSLTDRARRGRPFAGYL